MSGRRRPSKKSSKNTHMGFYNELNRIKYRLWKKFVYQPRLEAYLNFYYNVALDRILIISHNNEVRNSRQKLKKYLRGEAEILSKEAQNSNDLILTEPLFIIMKEAGIDGGRWGLISTATNIELEEQGIFPPNDEPTDRELREMELPHSIMEKLKRKYQE